MRFCVEHTDLETDKKADEIIYTISTKTNFVTFIDYLKQVGTDKRYILRCGEYSLDEEEKLENILLDLKKTQFNFAIEITFHLRQSKFKTFLEENNFDFFYRDPCFNLEDLSYMLQDNVSDIYIHGELAFKIQQLSYIKKNKKINFRVFVDAPVLSNAESCLAEIYPERMFWIRPEDIEMYALYIDVFEIGYRPNIKLDIYKKGVWEGPISALIPSIKIDAFCNNISPAFGHYRIKCDWKCMYDKCDLCKRNIELATAMSKADLEIRQVKDSV